MKSEKFNVITLILIILLIIVTLGASQVKANEDNLLLPGDDYSEAIFTNGESEQISYSGKEMPEAAAGLQRIVFSAQDFQPYNPAFWDFYTPRAHGCIALRIPDSSYEQPYGAYMPLPFTLGTKIVGMYATGYDGYGGADADLEFSIGRYAWRGDHTEYLAVGLSDDNQPFNIYIPANNINVEEGWAYFVKILYRGTYGSLDPDKFKVCQITVDYIPPSAFLLAFPSVLTSP